MAKKQRQSTHVRIFHYNGSVHLEGTILTLHDYGNAEHPDRYIEFEDAFGNYFYWKEGIDSRNGTYFVQVS